MVPEVLLCLFIINLYTELAAATLVYNLKIRRAFGVGLDGPAVQALEQDKLVASALPIYYQRKRHIVETARNIDLFDKHQVSGVLLNLRYVPNKLWWLEVSTGLEKETSCTVGTINHQASDVTYAKKGFDDLVFSAGLNAYPAKNWAVVMYGLGGIPTSRKLCTLDQFDTLLGTRCYALGAGYEISYAFFNSLEQALTIIFQNRLLHFFGRNGYPVLSSKQSEIHLGNVTDFLLALQYRNLRNIYEIGANLTVLSNAYLKLHPGYLATKTSVRESAYISFTHACNRFPLLTHPVFLGVGGIISYASKYNTRSFAVWFNFSTTF